MYMRCLGLIVLLSGISYFIIKSIILKLEEKDDSSYDEDDYENYYLDNNDDHIDDFYVDFDNKNINNDMVNNKTNEEQNINQDSDQIEVLYDEFDDILMNDESSQKENLDKVIKTK